MLLISPAPEMGRSSYGRKINTILLFWMSAFRIFVPDQCSASPERALPVSQVWGLSGITNTPVSCKQAEIDHVTICSYDDFIMGCSKSMIVNGTLADTSGNKTEIMTIYNKDNPLCRRRCHLLF